jgi:hypothetical protein
MALILMPEFAERGEERHGGLAALDVFTEHQGGDHVGEPEVASSLAGQREPQPEKHPIDDKPIKNEMPGSTPGALSLGHPSSTAA